MIAYAGESTELGVILIVAVVVFALVALWAIRTALRRKSSGSGPGIIR